MNPIASIILISSSEDFKIRLAEQLTEEEIYYPIETAKDIKSLIEVLNNIQCRIVIFDDNNTSLNVRNALETSRKLQPTSPFIVVSANTTPSYIVNVMKIGANDYITHNEFDKLGTKIKQNLKNDKIFYSMLENTANDNDIDLQVKERTRELEYATREVQKSESQLRKIIDISPIAIALVKVSDDKIFKVNDSYLEMLGYTRDEIMGKTANDLNLWVEPNQRVQILNSLRLKKYVKNREVHIRNKMGKHLTVVLSVEYIELKDEEPFYLFFAIDISNQTRYSEKLKRSLEEEKESIILKNRLISMISHELRAPLTTVMLSTDLLRRYSKKLSDDEKSVHYDRIQNTVLKLTKLMETVLTIGRLESGNFEFEPDYIDLASFCESVIENTEFNFDRKNKIKFSYENQCDEIRADENLLYLIFSNLLSNAVKYTPEDKDISLHLECRQGKARVTISDQGIGIPKHELDNLFRSFFRASNVGGSSGYGLGLSIVKKCVETHSGTISVESELNKGTTIVVDFPAI
jgi:PAS domain S-box-containing protein